MKPSQVILRAFKKAQCKRCLEKERLKLIGTLIRCNACGYIGKLKINKADKYA